MCVMCCIRLDCVGVCWLLLEDHKQICTKMRIYGYIIDISYKPLLIFLNVIKKRTFKPGSLNGEINRVHYCLFLFLLPRPIHDLHPICIFMHTVHE